MYRCGWVYVHRYNGANSFKRDTLCRRCATLSLQFRRSEVSTTRLQGSNYSGQTQKMNTFEVPRLWASQAPPSSASTDWRISSPRQAASSVPRSKRTHDRSANECKWLYNATQSTQYIPIHPNHYPNTIRQSVSCNLRKSTAVCLVFYMNVHLRSSTQTSCIYTGWSWYVLNTFKYTHHATS